MSGAEKTAHAATNTKQQYYAPWLELALPLDSCQLWCALHIQVHIGVACPTHALHHICCAPDQRLSQHWAPSYCLHVHIGRSHYKGSCNCYQPSCHAERVHGSRGWHLPQWHSWQGTWPIHTVLSWRPGPGPGGPKRDCPSLPPRPPPSGGPLSKAPSLLGLRPIDRTGLNPLEGGLIYRRPGPSPVMCMQALWSGRGCVGREVLPIP